MQPVTPDWVKHAVFYQIFPDRFARSLCNHQKYLYSSAALEAWSEPPTLQGYKGGNLRGIIERFDYLQELGINAIYLNPVFQSASNHRYHPHDYYQVDPLLGGNTVFKEFLEEAHKRNIRIILDGVFNHVSRGFFFFNDILEKDPDNIEKSPWIDWFIIKGRPLAPYPYDEKDRLEHPANYAGWKNHRALPQLNHNNHDVREYIMRVAEHWIQVGIDGWRLDAPNWIQASGFWQEFRSRVKAINSEAYIVGEIFGDATPWLDGSQFDGVTNYSFMKLTLSFTTAERIRPENMKGLDEKLPSPLDARAYADKILKLLERYDWEIQLAQLNLLGSHDTARLFTILGEDRAGVELSALLLFTFPGAPNIYYGDEVGLPGGPDPDCRRTFPSESEWNQEILSSYRQLIDLRHSHISLRIGRYQVLFAREKVYVFARLLDNEEIIVAVNVGHQATEVTIKSAEDIKVKTRPDKRLFGAGDALWSSDGQSNILSLSLPARSGLILGST
jgi:cyclomaltodextrinase/neopullulanase